MEPTRSIKRMIACFALSLASAGVAHAQGVWQSEASMQTARGTHGFAASGALVYAFGGDVSTLEAYDPVHDSWSGAGLTPMPGAARAELASCTIGGKIYVSCGWDGGTPYADVLSYDPAVNAWTTGLAPLPARGRRQASADAIDGILYLVGGYYPFGGTSGGALDELWAYDPGANTWTQKTSLPQARYGAAVAAVNGKLYVIGGVVGPDIAGSISSTVLVYDPLQDTWASLPSMPTAREEAAVGVQGGLVFVIGGGNDSSGALSTVEVLDTGSGMWGATTSMPTARSGARAALANGRIHVSGGNVISGGIGVSVTTLEALALPAIYVAARDGTVHAYRDLNGDHDFLGAAESTTFATGLGGEVFSVAVRPGDGHVFASVTGGNVFDITGGGDFTGAQPFALGLAGEPAIAFSPGGRLFATDPHVRDISPGGDFSNQASGLFSADFDGFFDAPSLMTFAPDGTLLVPEARPGSVKEVRNCDGLASVTLLSIGLNESNVMTAIRTSAGRILATNAFAGTVVDVTDGGDFSSAAPFAWGLPDVSCVVEADGRLYASFYHDPGGIVDITGGGPFSEAALVNGDAIVPLGMAFASCPPAAIAPPPPPPPPPTGTWAPVATMGDDMSVQASAVVGARLYSFGGRLHGGTAVSDVVQTYDPATNAWSSGAPMPVAKFGPAAAAIGGFVYVAGGAGPDGAPTYDTLDIYDPLNDQWAGANPMTTPRAVAAAAAVNGKLYVIGGLDGTGPLDAVEVFDPLTGSWTAGLAAMPTPRFAADADVLGGRIYVVGGNDGSGSSAAVEVYDPIANSWTSAASLPSGRQDPAARVLNGVLYAIGGYTTTQVTDALSYDPIADAWTALAPMSLGRYAFAAGAVGGEIVVAGGLTSTGSTAAAEAFTPALSAGAMKVYVASEQGNRPGGFSDGSINVYVDEDGDGKFGPCEATIFAWGVGGLNGVAIRPADGHIFAVRGDGVWDVTAGGDFSSVAPFASHLAGAIAIAFRDDGELFVAEQGSGAIRDITTPGDFSDPAQGAFASGISFLNGITFTRDGRLFVTGGTRSGIGVINATLGGDLSSAALYASGVGHAAGIHETSDGRLLVVGSEEGTVYDATGGGVAAAFAHGLPGAFDFAESSGHLYAGVGSGHFVDFTQGGDLTTAPFSNFDFVPGIGGMAATPGPAQSGNTPAGHHIVVTPAPGVQVRFSHVTAAGDTAATFSATGPTPPDGWDAASPYVEIATTAEFAGNVTVKIDYDPSGMTHAQEQALRLFHHEGGAWVDVTAGVGAGANRIRGRTTSLSPFLVCVDRTAPVVTIASPADGAIYLLHASLGASYGATDAGSGVAALSGPVAVGAPLDTSAVGKQAFQVTADDAAGDHGKLTVHYTVQYAPAGSTCLGEPSHAILGSIAADGSSKFTRGTVVSAKLRVSDASGASIGDAGVVARFELTDTNPSGAYPSGAWPDSFFWDGTAQEWVCAMDTASLPAGVKYSFKVTLADGTTIKFKFGVK